MRDGDVDDKEKINLDGGPHEGADAEFVWGN